jgi:hypothetical protein
MAPKTAAAILKGFIAVLRANCVLLANIVTGLDGNNDNVQGERNHKSMLKKV